MINFNEKYEKEYIEINKIEVEDDAVLTFDNRAAERSFGQLKSLESSDSRTTDIRVWRQVVVRQNQLYDHFKFLDETIQKELVWKGMRNREQQLEDDKLAEQQKTLEIMNDS
ncbi:Oidioi.mRNA.OKI2018_I69.PAR.g11814.t1.cds [Oikopleura dioica]|uniref:Oidioi.mRNA.OKI2018_I69.PAR.g11690.t1.cds n=1 Tax=Oikopleura dioica TaxID=34765 RepID=A0ABN7S3S3_OIKDI|nr:Oidioi.mRNA.OKI2018_I69.PAR.g11690.t1.cds [Oikopleura dioica]CAG5088354.1 Oidioi.mRNA.OKI2018_I69.PAR.g11814.t1.cds [Oikopleura dioica]